VFTSELLDAHRDALKEKEGTIAELLRRMKEHSAAGEVVSSKVSRLQAHLDHEVVVQQGREKELERLRGELEKKDSGL